MNRISQSAFTRLFALQKAELAAVRQMVAGDGYSDFFVEGSGPPWHEAFGDVVKDEGIDRSFSLARVTRLDGLRSASQDGGYSDFFVEGSGPPWHEAFTDVVNMGDPSAVSNRVSALSKLRVIQAYARANAAG